jgi:SSS family solute:Na+ symporter
VLTAVLIFYLALSLGIGFYTGGRAKSATDFLIAGRQLGLGLITATMSAVQIGAGVVLGGAEVAATSGVWPGLWYGIGCGGGLILAGLLVAARLRRLGGVVPLDFFGKRFGERRWVRIWAWLTNIPSLMGILVAQLLAAGSVLSIFGMDFRHGVILISVVLLFYSVMAGMWGVVLVDLVQVIIIVIGLVAATVVTLFKLGSMHSVSSLLATPFIPPGMGSKAVFLIVPFLLATSVSQNAFMRYQSAQTAKIAQWGSILAGCIVIFVSFCTALLGAAGHVLYPAVAYASVLPHTVSSVLPQIVGGIVVAGLLGATMNAGSSMLLGLAGSMSRDFYNMVLRPKKALDELEYGRLVSRATIVASLVAATLLAFSAKGILSTMILFNYPYMGSLLIPLLLGVLWKGGTTKGAFASMLVGGAVAVASLLVGELGWKTAWFNEDLGLFVAYGASALAFVAVSRLTRIPVADEPRLSTVPMLEGVDQ